MECCARHDFAPAHILASRGLNFRGCGHLPAQAQFPDTSSPLRAGVLRIVETKGAPVVARWYRIAEPTRSWETATAQHVLLEPVANNRWAPYGREDQPVASWTL